MDKGIYILKNEVNETVEEAYNALRANIYFCETEQKLKTLAFTSYGPGEGKSTTSINLGLSMAKTGMKILYIDADMRKPMGLKQLKNVNLNGLTNYLNAQASLEEIINKTNIHGFDFISSGLKTNTPSEIITSERFKDFLLEVKQCYDLVIIDTPPMGSVIDSAIIASQVDGTILVIEVKAVRCKNALMMKEQLLKANVNILGIVLTKIQKNDYKNYYGSYDYYGKYKNKMGNKMLNLLKKMRPHD